MPLKIHYISFPGLGIGEMKINTNIAKIVMNAKASVLPKLY